MEEEGGGVYSLRSRVVHKSTSGGETSALKKVSSPTAKCALPTELKPASPHSPKLTLAPKRHRDFCERVCNRIEKQRAKIKKQRPDPTKAYCKASRDYEEAAIDHYTCVRAQKFGSDAPVYELTHRTKFCSIPFSWDDPIIHLNFEVKIKDDPQSDPLILFAQLRKLRDGLVVDCCTKLGRSQDLLGGPDRGACRLCKITLLHPERGCKRLLSGYRNEDISWLSDDEEVKYNSDIDYR